MRRLIQIEIETSGDGGSCAHRNPYCDYIVACPYLLSTGREYTCLRFGSVASVHSAKPDATCARRHPDCIAAEQPPTREGEKR